jgi:hypothetical protein
LVANRLQRLAHQLFVDQTDVALHGVD